MLSCVGSDDSEPSESRVSVYIGVVHVAGCLGAEPCPVRPSGAGLGCVTGGYDVSLQLQCCGPLQGVSV